MNKKVIIVKLILLCLVVVSPVFVLIYPQKIKFLADDFYIDETSSIEFYRVNSYSGVIDFDEPHKIILHAEELNSLLSILKEARYRDVSRYAIFRILPTCIAFWCPEILDRYGTSISFSTSYKLNLGSLAPEKAEELKNLLSRIEKRMLSKCHLEMH